MDWNCIQCCELFPFYGIDDDEFIYLNTHFNISVDVKDTYELCTEIDLEVFKYSNFKENDHERDIDPDNNFYDDIETRCKYFTDSQFKTLCKDSTGFSIIHFNCRSLNSNHDKIEHYLHELSYKFDVIAMTETWAKPETEFDFDLEGYDVYHLDRKDKKGGGVAIFINNVFNHRIINELSMTYDGLMECLTIELCLKKSKNIIVSSIYRTPGSSIDMFIERFSDTFSTCSNDKELYICGDFNIDLLKYKIHQNTSRFVDMIFSLGLFPLITKPSRITQHSHTLIDNIITNNIQQKTNSGLLLNDISDHLPVFVIVQKHNEVKGKKIYRYIREVNGDTISAFKNDLLEQYWEHVYSENEINSAYDKFIKTFMFLYDKSKKDMH